MKLKLYQVYNGTVIGVRSKRWDSQSHQKIYAYSRTHAISIALKEGSLKRREMLPEVKPSFFQNVAQRLRFWR